MKKFKEYTEEKKIVPKKTVTYSAHDYYGTPEQKVTPAKSSSSSHGD